MIKVHIVLQRWRFNCLSTCSLWLSLARIYFKNSRVVKMKRKEVEIPWIMCVCVCTLALNQQPSQLKHIYTNNGDLLQSPLYRTRWLASFWSTSHSHDTHWDLLQYAIRRCEIVAMKSFTDYYCRPAWAGDKVASNKSSVSMCVTLIWLSAIRVYFAIQWLHSLQRVDKRTLVIVVHNLWIYYMKLEMYTQKSVTRGYKMNVQN